MFYFRQRTLLKLYKTPFAFISPGERLKRGLAAPPAWVHCVSGGVPRLTRLVNALHHFFRQCYSPCPISECILPLASDIMQTLLKLSVLLSCSLRIYWSAGVDSQGVIHDAGIDEDINSICFVISKCPQEHFRVSSSVTQRKENGYGEDRLSAAITPQ